MQNEPKSHRLLYIDSMKGLILFLATLNHVSYPLAPNIYIESTWNANYTLFYSKSDAGDTTTTLSQAIYMFIVNFLSNTAPYGFYFFLGYGMIKFYNNRYYKKSWTKQEIMFYFLKRGLVLIFLAGSINTILTLIASGTLRLDLLINLGLSMMIFAPIIRITGTGFNEELEMGLELQNRNCNHSDTGNVVTKIGATDQDDQVINHPNQVKSDTSDAAELNQLNQCNQENQEQLQLKPAGSDSSIESVDKQQNGNSEYGGMADIQTKTNKSNSNSNPNQSQCKELGMANSAKNISGLGLTATNANTNTLDNLQHADAEQRRKQIDFKFYAIYSMVFILLVVITEITTPKVTKSDNYNNNWILLFLFYYGQYEKIYDSSFTLIPWIAIMCLGIMFAHATETKDNNKVRIIYLKYSYYIIIVSFMLFIFVKCMDYATNVDGNKEQVSFFGDFGYSWNYYDNKWKVLQFVDACKFPPSLAFICIITVEFGLILMFVFYRFECMAQGDHNDTSGDDERRSCDVCGRIGKFVDYILIKMIVIGKTTLFFWVFHWYPVLIIGGLVAFVVDTIMTTDADSIPNVTVKVSLLLPCTVLVNMVMYFLCKRYLKFKSKKVANSIWKML